MSEAWAVGAWWKQQRLAAGLTQEQLAGKSGLSTRAISNLERGRTGRPYPQSLQALAAALGLPEDAGTTWATRLRADRALSRLSSDALRQLPAAVRHFTGRQAELDALTTCARSAGAHAGSVLISAIDGMAGIGKTALAVHWANTHAEDFPDGQLYVDLRGYTLGQRPRTPDEALNWLLRALGLHAEQIPADHEQAAALYRQRLAGTRTLIVLDNAATEAQIRPLLPGTGSCLVLITSRRRLKGLDDARILSLDLLSLPESIELLRAVAGPDRVADEDPLPTRIAELCGYLPLALRIAAALLRHRPAWTLADLAGLLTDQHRRVQALSDGERDLSAVFDLSYSSLSEPHRVLFRRLGLIPGSDLDSYAAAALLEVDPAAAAGLLEDLVDHNLLLCHAPGRYRLHDLIRAHARTLASADPAPGRECAVDRLLRYYAHTAHTASTRVARCARPAPVGPTPAHAPALPDPETARAWLRAERDNLQHAAAYAHTRDLHEHTLALTAGLAEILRTDGPYTHALALHQAAAETAEHHGRPAAHADALIDLGIMRRMSGDLAGAQVALARARAIHHATGDRSGEAEALVELARAGGPAGDMPGAGEALSQALEIYRTTGDRHGEADALADLGIMRRATGDPAAAQVALARALEIHRATGDRHGEADALTELARARTLLGDLVGAQLALIRALAFYRATRHHHGEAYALTNLGAVQRLLGDPNGACDSLIQALEFYRAIGYRLGEAETLTNLGAARSLLRDSAGAQFALGQALEIYRTTGHRHDEACALNHYAANVAAFGDLSHALMLYQRALSLTGELDKRDDQAVALEGLAACHLANGDIDAADSHLRQALEIYQCLGMTLSARRVQGLLGTLTPPGMSRTTVSRHPLRSS
ncbi:MAG TPA: tetratricopeptide repeat protein [Pseudonocardiaceae bacterium]|nr:tetratricopeptide repeat protein [Pseudonocardiaceae bacterium]